MKSITLEHILSQVREAAASPLGDMRIVDTIDFGQFARQGDIYIRRIAEPSDGWVETENRQLAPGSTQGSRHTVSDSVRVLVAPTTAMKRRQTDRGLAFEGPQLVSEDRFTVSHPEHADISLPGGCYEVLYQSDFQSQQRAKD